MTRAANVNNAEITTPSDREIRIERVFDASRDRVRRALTEPELVKKWWGLEMLRDPDATKAQRAMKAALQMKRFDVAALEQAYAGT